MRLRKPASLRGRVPFLTDSAIEAESDLLLAEYALGRRAVLAPPVPIENILELHLQLNFSVMDLRAELGVPNVLGARWVDTATVGVDRSLDPVVNPAREGRYHFTLAHEVGHWRLHRRHFLADHDQAKFAGGHADAPSYVCRDGSKAPEETQANRFAACLLMPRAMLRAAWQEQQGDDQPLVLPDLCATRPELLTQEIARRNFEPVTKEDADDMILEGAARPLAQRFRVSPWTMRIRLEELGLLCRKPPEPGLFS